MQHFYLIVVAGVQWFLTVASVCTSLEAGHVPSWAECLCVSFACFRIVFSCPWVLRVLYVFWREVFHQTCALQEFSLCQQLVFHLKQGLLQTHSFNLMRSHYQPFLMWLLLLLSHLRALRPSSGAWGWRWWGFSPVFCLRVSYSFILPSESVVIKRKV